MPKCSDCTFVVYRAEISTYRQSAWYCFNPKSPLHKSHGPVESYSEISGESFRPLFEKREID